MALTGYTDPLEINYSYKPFLFIKSTELFLIFGKGYFSWCRTDVVMFF